MLLYVPWSLVTKDCTVTPRFGMPVWSSHPPLPPPPSHPIRHHMLFIQGTISIEKFLFLGQTNRDGETHRVLGWN